MPRGSGGVDGALNRGSAAAPPAAALDLTWGTREVGELTARADPLVRETSL